MKSLPARVGVTLLKVIRSKLRLPTVRTLMVGAGLLIALMFTPPGRWLLVRGPDKAELALDVRLDAVQLDSVTMEQALKSIGDRANVDVVVNWPGIRKVFSAVEPVSLHLHNVTVRQAMQAAFEASGIAFELVEIEPEGRNVQIDLVGAFDDHSALRLYDVNKLVDEDLVANAAWQKPAATRPSQGANGLGNFFGNNPASVSSGITRRSSTALIADVLGWTSDGQGMYSGYCGAVQPGVVAINRPHAEHQKIKDLLKLLASATASESSAGHQLAAATPLAVSQAALQVKIVDLNLQNVTLRAAVNRLNDMTHINVIVPANVAPTLMFSLHVKDVTAEQALDMIYEMASDHISDLAIRYRGDGIFGIIPAAERVEGIPAVYDVNDLIAAIANNNAPHVGDREGTTEPWEAAIEGLVRLLQVEIDPDSWREGGGEVGSIQVVGRRLLIEQSPLNHRRIERLFGTLRKEFLGTPFEQPDLAARLKAIGPDQDQHFAEDAEPLAPDIPELHLNGVTIMQAMRQLSAMSRARLAYSAVDLANADIDLEKPIQLSARDVSVETATKLAFDAVAAPGTVEVSETNFRHNLVVRSRREAPTRIYDVRDLLNLPSTTPAADATDPGFEWEYQALDRLQTILMESVDTDSWKDSGGTAGDVRYLGGRFFIHQTLENHAAIERFLQHLRDEHGRKRIIGGSLRERWREYIANESAPATQDSQAPESEKE